MPSTMPIGGVPKTFREIAGLQGVAAGATAFLNLPRDRAYYGLVLQVNSTANVTVAGALGQIRVKVNGTTRQAYSPFQLDSLFAMLTGNLDDTGDLIAPFPRSGIPLNNSSTEIFVPFSPGFSRDTMYMNALALGTADMESFTMEIDILAAATAPTIRVFAVTTIPGQNAPSGSMIVCQPFARNIAGATTDTLANIETIESGFFIGMGLDSTNVKNVQIQANGEDRVNASPAIINAQKALFGRRAGAIDPLGVLLDYTLDGSGAIPTAGRTITSQVTYSGANAVGFYLPTFIASAIRR